ncbi:MAG: Zn-dependent hydrolase [Leptolyngbya sp. SIO1D8]|nr:Zn-dependent hydrolase [Leptolyngbya sp. SIO1D8]
MTNRLISTIAIDPDRLMTAIKRLAQVGQLPNGGVQRLAFSPEDCRARQLVQAWMREAGMTVKIDAAGNIIGRYAGRYDAAPPLVTGSHIDTVPNAGHYDGTYGVLAGIEVVRALAVRGQRLDHPLEVIVFADEERSMIGCKALAGQLSPDPELYRGREGDPVDACLEWIGGEWGAISQVRRTPGSMAAFVELHVEQGPVLESVDKQIGVVTGIVGQRRYWITIEGQSSHAGTTPMPMRKDALVAASQVVLAVHRFGNQAGDQVATVGKMELHPNVPNSIPGRIEMSLDIRDLSSDRLDALIIDIQAEIHLIAAQTQTRIYLAQRLNNEPALANSHIQSAISQACETLQLSYYHLPSRASHDAQEMSRITDMGMIFVPSEGGISHAEQEYTSPEACTHGANVLLHTLMRLDRHYRCSGSDYSS